MRVDGIRLRLADAESERDAHAHNLAMIAKSSFGQMALRWVRFSYVHARLARWLARPMDMVRLAGHALPVRFRRESPLFDGSWYVATYADAVGSSDPWRYFLAYGLLEGHSPNAYFDPRWYLEHNPDIRRWRRDPLGHYLRVGGFEGRDPGPDFDSDWYLAANPDVAASGLNPLVHFLTRGVREGRLPASAMAVLFDADWYLAQHPDVAQSGLDPLSHYRRIGAREGRAPNDAFDVVAYRYDHPDVVDHDDDVLLHYTRVGRDKGATPHPLFDPVWYRHHNDDVGEFDPYEHYLRVGRAEGRAPSAAVPPGTDIRMARVALPQAPPGQAQVTIIIPVFGQAALTLRCLHALARHTPPDASVQVIVADDDPDRPLGPLLEDATGLEVIANSENLGFLRNCNAAAKRAEGDFLVFLNRDAVVLEGWLEAFLEVVGEDQHVGLVGARIIDLAGHLREAGAVLFRDGIVHAVGRGDDPDAPECSYLREVDAVTCGGFLVRREAWDAVGGFDGNHAEGPYGASDLSFRLASAGWKVVYQPAARIISAGLADYGFEVVDHQPDAGQTRFVARWAEELATRYKGPADLFMARQRPSARGTVLVIDDAVPEYDRHAGWLTIYQYLRLLVDEGFRVMYLPEDGRAPEPYTGVLQRLGIEVLFGAVDSVSWYVDNGVHLDWVIVARPHIASRHLDHIRRRSRARVLYYTHDIHSLRERRRFEVTGDAHALAESERLLAEEGDIFRRVDCVLTPSADEVDVIRELAPHAVIHTITPFFWRAGQLSPITTPPLTERRDIVFLGAYEHTPNVDAATFLVRDIMPLVWARVPDARAVLAGAYVVPEVAQLAGGRVEVTGYVPDLASVWARARMSVSPLRYGAGVKGKIVEALRAGVPVITTPVGNEGIGLDPGVEVLIGETPSEIAGHVIHLLEDPSALVALGAAGNRVVNERFSYERARAEILAALGSPLSSPATPSIS